MNAWSQGHVVHRQDWAPGLTTLRLQADIEPFSPGQWVNLALTLQGAFVRRSYSLSSAPGEPPEFFLTRVSGGVLTPALFELPIGAAVMVERKPQGFFTLRYVPEAAEAWFVATGTGLGPYIAMLRTAEPWQRFERIVVVHGVRRVADLAYRDELVERSQEHGGKLTWVPVVSREPEAEGVLHGRITTTLHEGALERAAGLSLSAERSHVLLCGNPEMIADMTQGLAERGLRKHRVRKPGHITVEKYWDPVPVTGPSS
jgi:ferredoxin--NADP+ reductase